MYRVLLRVIQIFLHVQETLLLEVVLKKNKQSIKNDVFYPLINGVAHINLTTEFLVSSADPSFELYLNFTFNNIKKLAGYILLNLHDWFSNNSYHEIRTLEKSPGNKAKIQFNFIYFDSGIKSNNFQFLSLDEFEKQSQQKYQNQIQKEHETLHEKNKELNIQKKLLIQENQKISQAESQRNNQYQKIYAFYNAQINEIEQQMHQTADELRMEQEKSQFLINLVLKSGYASLISAVNEIGNAQTTQIEEEQNFPSN